MTSREKNLLQFLSASEAWVTSSQISSKFGISTRSVKNYVKRLNFEHKNLILTSKAGYRIADYEQVQELLRKEQDAVPQDRKERMDYLIRLLLLHDKKIDLENLSSNLCISMTTLNVEISQIRKILSRYNLSFRTRNNLAFIEGAEKDKKEMINDYLYNEMKRSNNHLETLERYFTSIHPEELRSSIRSILRAHRLYMDDFSMTNLLLHLAITSERCIQGSNHVSSDPGLPGGPFSGHILEVAEEIAASIHEHIQVQFSRADIYDICAILSTRITHEQTEDYENVLSPEILSLMEKIELRLRQYFGLTPGSRDFRIRFGIHLSNMIERLNNHIKLRSLETDSIKQQFPMVYDIAVSISDIIEQETLLSIPRDEIAFIALHIGVLCEEQISMQEKVKGILLYPPYGDGLSSMLEKLMLSFEDSLLITDVVHTFDEIPGDRDYDILITSVLLPDKPERTVYVGRHLGSNDILLVANQIEKIRNNKEQLQIVNRIQTFFKPDLFFTDLQFKNEQDAIETLCDHLYASGYVDKGYKASIYKREAMSSCGYDKVAIPHPTLFDAPRTVISVSLHPQGFLWGNYKVYIVLMLAVNPKDTQIFRDVFQYITRLILKKDGLKKLLQAESYEQFISVLSEDVYR